MFKNKKGESVMIKVTKEKKYYWEKFNPIELYIFRNKKHFGKLLQLTPYFSYGSRYSKWSYDVATEEFTFNTFAQVEKHKWSKEPVEKRIPAIKLLKGSNNPESPMWLEFQKSLTQYQKENQ